MLDAVDGVAVVKNGLAIFSMLQVVLDNGLRVR